MYGEVLFVVMDSLLIQASGMGAGIVVFPDNAQGNNISTAHP